MKRRYLLLTLINALFTILIVKSDNRYLVDYHNCATVSNDNKSLLQGFFDKTNTYLQAYDIEVIFAADTLTSCEFSKQETITQILFYDTNKDEPYIKISLSSDEIHKISNILGNDIIIEIPLNQEKSEEFLASLLLYSVGRIDIAQENLLAFQEDKEYKDLELEIAYYLSNIAILKGDMSLATNQFPDSWWLDTGKFFGTNFAWILLQLRGDVEVIDVMTDAVNRYHESENTDGEIDSLVDRASIYALSFDYTSGIKDMDSAIQLAEENQYSDTDMAILYKQRGDIIMLIYEWNRAYDDYNKAIELNPNYAEAYYRRGILRYTWFEREKAVEDFQTYLDLTPEGHFAETATQYISDIQTEIDALGA